MTKRILILLFFCSVVLTTPPHIGTKCKTDAACVEGWETCSNQTHKCVHKQIFPMNALEYLGSIFIFLQLIFSNAGGLGGGGILIATMMAFFKFDAKNAIAISNVTIFSSATFRFLLNLKQKHPQKENGVIVEYNYAILMLPMVIVGTAIGVFVYVILPEVIIIAILTVFLLYLFIMTTIKAVTVYKAERQALMSQSLQNQNKTKTLEQKAQSADTEQDPQTQQQKPEDNVVTPNDVQIQGQDQVQMTDTQQLKTTSALILNKESPSKIEQKDELLSQILERESGNLSQWRKLLLNIIMMVSLLVISIIRGKGDGSMTGIIKCSPVDWFLFVLLIAIGVVLTIVAVVLVRREYFQKCEVGYKFVPGELVCSPKVVVKLTLVSFGCGFAAGSLGLGTGIILNPTLMQLGLHPVVASATGMYMVIYSTLSASIVVTIFGKMNFAYACNSILLVLAGTFLGIRIQNVIVQQWKKNSLVVMALGVCILWCLVAIPAIVFDQVAEKAASGVDFMQFTSYCTAA